MLSYVVRAVAMYVTALIIIRIMGKRALGELGLFDFVVMTGVGHILTSVALDQSLPFYDGVLVLIVLAFMEYATSFISMKSQKIATLITGRPVVMIENGRIIKENLAREKFNVDDLMQELRKQGIRDVKEVEKGILEPSGGFSVILKAESEPVTRGELGIKWEPETGSILTYHAANRAEIFNPPDFPRGQPEMNLTLPQALEDINTKLDSILKRLENLEGRT